MSDLNLKASLDFRSLEGLKRDLRTGDATTQKDATKVAAKKFEAEFLNLLMKQMRAALPQEDALASDSTRSWQGMLDQHMAQAMSGKGVGLAELIEKQLTRSQTKPPLPGEVLPAAIGKPLTAAPTSVATTGSGQVRKVATAPAPFTDNGIAGRVTAGNVRKVLTNQRDFVERMAGEAQAAAQKTGVPAEFIVGQAALESGWGKHEIRAADGTQSHNLFGIKAGANWTGKTVEVTTTEYVNGVAQKVKAQFRAYDSYAEGFADYAKLVGGSARYAASRNTSNPAQFAQALQRGGYATDPRYADKLTSVIRTTQSITRAMV